LFLKPYTGSGKKLYSRALSAVLSTSGWQAHAVPSQGEYSWGLDEASQAEHSVERTTKTLTGQGGY